MDNILWISLSRMFALGAILLMLCAGLSSALQCNRTRHYRVGNKLSGKLLKCIDCRVCPVGSEPKVPCGTFIGVSDSVGDCDPCKNGTYSPKKDFKACQDCLYKKCFEHQVVEGTCTDKNDASYCTAKCEEGHIMNKERTACDIDLVQQTKTTPPATKTTSNPPSPTTNSNTTKKLVVSHDQTDKESKLAPGVIVGIVIAVVVVIVVIIFMVIRWYRLRRTDPGDKDDKELQASTARLLDKTDAGGKELETVKFSKQEQSQENGLLTANQPHCSETTRGFVDSNPAASDNVNPVTIPNIPPQNPTVSNIANDTNMAYMAGTPPHLPNSPVHVAIETPVQSPANMLLGSLAQPERMVHARQHLPPPIARSPQPSMYVPNNFIVNDPDPMRFDGLPFIMYNRVCEEFDVGPPGKDWRALAGWLGLNVIDVKRIEKREYKTHEVIQTWVTEAGNDVNKFIQIMNVNKMTYLAGEIIKARRA